MTKIRILPEREARKIAAGEVVERPVSVVKELLENALDAHTTTITLVLINGGKTRIEIRDNGCGMSPEDARLCTAHHATSKLDSVDQLPNVTTFGFRGEALASIAAVSKMQIITRRCTDEVGIHITLDAGTIMSECAVGANVGTTIIVEDLFFNIPARRKFMKQRDTEWRSIHQLMCATALVSPTICFTVFHDGQQLITTRTCTTILERAEQLLGQETVSHLIPLVSSEAPVRVEGIVTTHQYGRYDRRNIFCFVNRRWVKNHILGKALMAGYNNVLPAGKFPVAVLAITIDPEEVDVNIHPRKEEVMLLHPQGVSAAIQDIVNKTLHAHIGHQFVPVQQLPHRYISTHRTFPQHHTIEQKSPYTQNNIAQAPHIYHYDSSNENETAEKVLLNTRAADSMQPHANNQDIAPVTIDQDKNTTEYEKESEASDTTVQLSSYEIIGQFSTTYILVETASGLLLVDQHAAHECVIYQQLTQKETNCTTTKLLFPEFIQLAEDDIIRMEPYLKVLQQLGIEAEIWGNNQIVITATSILLNTQPHNDIIMELLKKIDSQSVDTLHQEVLHRVRALVACKAAVKAGDMLSMQEQQGLISSYLATEKRLSCPHGRPTSWLISNYEFERKFKRVTS